MARVFTITPGLENMGALKTGGQGSVYKGRRIGEIITAIKILPTPIISESGDDKNYLAFKNEVAKLIKVNEKPSPYVVKFLGSGVTEAGNFPFIEMEFIEGPDLEQLLKPPHDPIFTIIETVKVAEQLANAIAHCHAMGIRHGDIKSNNVKLNTESGNYILLDFGLAIMSDEQRRSSYQQAGAIEFMAPEQNSGQMLFQTDIYSFGIILFELLTGSVPFPLKNGGEIARNDVRLAHMVEPVPDLRSLRRAALPLNWSVEKQQHEMQVPEWMVSLIYKCLEKKPERRFSNGKDLFSFISQKSILNDGIQRSQIAQLQQTEEAFIAKAEDLKKEIADHRNELLEKEKELTSLKILYQQKEQKIEELGHRQIRKVVQVSGTKKVSVTAFVALLLVTCAFAAYVAYPLVKNNLSSAATNESFGDSTNNQTNNFSENGQVSAASDSVNRTTQTEQAIEVQPDSMKISSLPKPDTIRLADQNVVKDEQPTTTSKSGDDNYQSANKNIDESSTSAKPDGDKQSQSEQVQKPEENKPDNPNVAQKDVPKKYLVASKAFFYNNPDENTRREEFISPLENAVVDALQERYGFIYVVITNPQGQVFKGWLRKRDLKLYSNE